MELQGCDLPCLIWIEITDPKVKRKAGLGGFEQRGAAGTVRDWMSANGYKSDRRLRMGSKHFDFVFVRTTGVCSEQCSINAE